MHHITYKDYEGKEQLVRIPAANIKQVLFLCRQLQQGGFKYEHVFWD